MPNTPCLAPSIDNIRAMLVLLFNGIWIRGSRRALKQYPSYQLRSFNQWIASHSNKRVASINGKLAGISAFHAKGTIFKKIKVSSIFSFSSVLLVLKQVSDNFSNFFF